MNIVLVTGNKNKLREFKEILSLDFENKEIDLDEIQSLDLKEICEHKARQAYDLVQKPVIVEDTGLFLDELNGLPGPFIKFFELKDRLGNSAAIKLLRDSTNRKAKQICIVTYYDGKNFIFCEGVMEGEISYDLRGGEGFGFDYCFIPESYDKTFSELGLEHKNKISARRKAIEKLEKSLKF